MPRQRLAKTRLSRWRAVRRSSTITRQPDRLLDVRTLRVPRPRFCLLFSSHADKTHFSIHAFRFAVLPTLRGSVHVISPSIARRWEGAARDCRVTIMDTSYLEKQVSTIINKLHELFDEIGIPNHDRDSRESAVRPLFSHAEFRH